MGYRKQLAKAMEMYRKAEDKYERQEIETRMTWLRAKIREEETPLPSCFA